MKKILLVVLIGEALAFNVYGFIDYIIDYYNTNIVEEVNKGYEVVYVE